MNNSIKFRIAAKTDVGLVRENNEDNFQASSDLSVEPMRWVNNEICSLGEKGALLVVADGMGGMNAGEVASELAIETVRNAFRSRNLTDEVMKNRFTIEKFMNSVIIDADKRIKAEAKSHPESRGMGTTIVVAWLLNGKLYVSWCGDSRAYIYNPQVGLHQISKDHSYVQSLVDKGAISKEDAFDYPESNIITRCLSDSSTKAKPESLLQPYDICDNDIIMLCTDGLSGMVRDNEIEDIIRKNEHDMDACSDGLIQAACNAEGADNITICMCQIIQGAGICNPNIFDAFDERLAGPVQNSLKESDFLSTKIIGSGKNRLKWFLGTLVLLLLMTVTLGIVYKKGMFSKKENSIIEDTSIINIPSTTSITKQTLADNLGNPFYIESDKEDPQKGDKAYPDGEYKYGTKIIVIKDSTIISIDTLKNEIVDQDTEAKIGADVSSKGEEESSQKSSHSGISVPHLKEGNKPSTNSEDGRDENDGPDKDEELTPVPVKETGHSYVEKTHEVKTGETLFSIGSMYGISSEDIKKLNPSIKENTIRPGDKIKIIYIKVK